MGWDIIFILGSQQILHNIPRNSLRKLECTNTLGTHPLFTNCCSLSGRDTIATLKPPVMPQLEFLFYSFLTFLSFPACVCWTLLVLFCFIQLFCCLLPVCCSLFVAVLFLCIMIPFPWKLHAKPQWDVWEYGGFLLS